MNGDQDIGDSFDKCNNQIIPNVSSTLTTAGEENRYRNCISLIRYITPSRVVGNSREAVSFSSLPVNANDDDDIHLIIIDNKLTGWCVIRRLSDDVFSPEASAS